MSYSSYSSYISGRRAYRTNETCVAQGPQGQQGLLGLGGTGPQGDQGNTGPAGGPQGITGPTGPQGKSLSGKFEIIFAGLTELEKATIHGDGKGPTGPAIYYGTGDRNRTLIGSLAPLAQDELFIQFDGSANETSQGGIIYNMKYPKPQWAQPSKPNDLEKNVILRGNKTNFDGDWPSGNTNFANFPEIIFDSAKSIFNVKIGALSGPQEKYLDLSGNQVGGAGALSISQSASGIIGADPDTQNEYIVELGDISMNAPANLKFGRLKDNLRLESRTMISGGSGNATRAGPKSSILFSAENYEPIRRELHIFGQGAIVLENSIKTEVTGDMAVGDVSYNLNFYIQSGGAGGTALSYNPLALPLSNSLPVLSLSNTRTIHANAPIVWESGPAQQLGAAAFQLGNVPTGPTGNAVFLDDVRDNHMMIYNAASGKWINRSVSTVGLNGPQGDRGEGDIGGFTYMYDNTISTGTNNTITFDNSDPTSSSNFFIGTNDNDPLQNDLSNHINSWDNFGGTNNKGIITITQKSNPRNGIVFRITDSVVSSINSIGFSIDSSSIASLGNGLQTGENHTVQFTHSGQGSGSGSGGGTGITGMTGITGYQGHQGYTGITGYQGAQGYTGPTGAQGKSGGGTGLTGYTGMTGMTGYQGQKGEKGLDGGGGGGTGPTGFTGLTGAQGLTGAVPDSSVWYQSWNLTTSGPGQHGANLNKVQYFHGFIAPISGIYNTIRVRTREVKTGVTAYAAIYSSTSDTTTPTPLNRMSLVNPVGVSITLNDTFYDINIGNTTLTRGKIYFIGIRFNNNSNGGWATFYASDTHGTASLNSLAWISRAPVNSDTWMATQDALDITTDIEGTFWFTVYGPQTVDGATQGPTGLTGMTGDKGAQGVTGFTGITGEKGAQGFTGYTGMTGVQGVTGFTGMTGDKGEKGERGEGVTGMTGMTGDKGEKGEKGEGITGITGMTGYQGVTGYTGMTGDKGEKGERGEGQTGMTGFTGMTGDKGEKGQRGEGVTGMTGMTGDKGEKGERGEGVTGMTGMTGMTGDKGAQGFTGYTGMTGDKGEKGERGEGVTGMTGMTGDKGEKGEKGEGITGITGMTGYQGVTGYTGMTGDKGQKGEAGSDGSFGGASFDYTFSTEIAAPTAPFANGQLRLNDSTQSSSTTLYIDDADDNGADVDVFMTTIHNVSSIPKGFVRISSGSNNNVFHLFQITQTTNQGDYWEVTVTNQSSSTASPFNDGDDIIVSFVTNGNKGQKGEKGELGTQGVTGYTGMTGAQGITGYTGMTGEKGEKGQRGQQGFTGFTGMTGEKGEKGQRGQQGFTGFTGMTGDKGEKGQRGQQGFTGFTGMTGDKGEKGQRGPQGFTGFTGMTGDKGEKGQIGTQGSTGFTGMTGYQGMKGEAGDAGTKSSMLRLVMKDNFTLVADSYYGVPFSETHNKYVSGNIWTIQEANASSTLGTHITVTERITASIKFAGTIFVPNGNTNKNSFLRLSKRPNGGSWDFVSNTKIAFGSSAATQQGVTGESGGSGFGNVYTAYGSTLIDLDVGDSIKLNVYSYSEDIDLLGETGLNHLNGDGDVNFGDTFIEIIDMLGGRQGPTGSQGYTGVTGPQGSGVKGEKGAQGFTGFTGMTGLQGEKGEKGERGEGFTGMTGMTGYQGQKGEGITGATGPQGQLPITNTFNVTVSSSGGSGNKYHIDGTQQADINLFRGFTYIFSLANSVSGHPFAIQTDSGPSYDSGMVYTDGITASPGPYNVGNNFPESGTITFTVLNNAPNNLYYRCKHHSGMGGTIIIKDLTLATVSGDKGEKGQNGTKGVTGMTGMTGDKGEKGQIGTQGFTGYTGMTGDKGEKGERGPQGFTGYTGMTGLQGEKGQNGTKGVTGMTGMTGDKGEKGFIGPQGFTGFTGMTGMTGDKGEKGQIGTQGFTGYTGMTGDKGEKGERGPQGFTGYTGMTGDKGIRGEKGNKGVTGPKGHQGDKGDGGSQGVTGYTGMTGHQGHQGKDGNFGGASFDYTFESPTSPGTSADGRVRLNNNTGSTPNNQKSSTNMYIDAEDDSGFSIANFMTTISLVNNPTTKGFVRISKKDDPTIFLLFQITEVENNVTYYDLTIGHQAGSGLDPLTNNMDVIVSFTINGNRGDIGQQGSRGFSGFTGMTGPQGPKGQLGSESAAFRACLDITTEHDEIQGNAQVSGEIEIPLVPNSNTPTNYVDLKYDKISYNDSNFSLNTSSGVITVLKQMKAMITYSTSFRINNNSQAVFFQKIQVDSGNGFEDVENSGFSAAHDAASYRKSTSTGVMIMDLNTNDKIKIKIAAGRFSNTGGNDSCFATKDSSIQIVDLFGGTMGLTGLTGMTGLQGEKGQKGEKGNKGITGSQGLTGFTGMTGLQGEKGQKGEKGNKGITGPQGYTGFTGMTGLQGEKGQKGQKGQKGITGPQGYTGFTGMTGLQGEKGQKGQKGQKGITGPQGYTGFTGMTGMTGPLGHQGFTGYTGMTGIQGEKGQKGQKGQIGQGYAGHGTYHFLGDLSGSYTQWALNGEPPGAGGFQDPTGTVNDLQKLEFIPIQGTHLLYNKFPSFPMKDAVAALTNPVPSRIQHNAMFGYVMPTKSQIIGFSVDFCQRPEDVIFYIMAWDPDDSQINGNAHQAQFTKPIAAKTNPTEPFASGCLMLDEPIDMKPGTYLFAVADVGASLGNGGSSARGLTHITAYVRFVS